MREKFRGKMKCWHKYNTFIIKPVYFKIKRQIFQQKMKNEK